MQELYEKYGKRGNFMVIGSHCQGRDEEKILELLKQKGVEYPVYGRLSIAGMPSFSGIPYAAIVDHRGKYVTSGRLREVLAALPKVISAAPLPIPGSLLGGLEVKHNKQVERRLVFGQNIESVMRQLKSRAKQDSEGGREAAEIVKACEVALNEWKTKISKQLETTPGLALDTITRFGRTCPSEAGQYSADVARLKGNPNVKKMVMFRKEIQKMEDVKPKTKGRARNAVRQVMFKRRQYAPLSENTEGAVQLEAQALLARFDAVIEVWNGLAQGGK